MGVSQAKKTKQKKGLFAVMNEKGEVENDAGAPWSIVVFSLPRFRNGNVQFSGSDGRHRASLQPPPADVFQDKKVSLRESVGTPADQGNWSYKNFNSPENTLTSQA